MSTVCPRAGECGRDGIGRRLLAEIFMLRLETAMRAAKEPAVKEVVANGWRFVPITLPAKTRVLRSRRKQPPIKEG